MTNTAPTPLSAMQAATEQANPLSSMHDYTPLVISRTDKNKQLTLFSKGKHAFIGRNMLMALHILRDI
jgi:hypothetical protein